MAVCVRGGCASVGFRPVTGRGLFFREGIRRAGMLAFPFAAAHEPAKCAERVSHGLREGIRQAEMPYRQEFIRNGGRRCTRKFQQT